MGGFLNSTLNLKFKKSIYDSIIETLIKCSDVMKKDCLISKKKIANHEEKIRTHLLENYLENDDLKLSIGIENINLRFIPEVPESYNSSKEMHDGRVDIKVVSADWLKNKSDYYIIECKRIDGKRKLNELYIKEGISRFVIPPIKYPSYNKKNIMLAFVVLDIDIENNVNSIVSIHENVFSSIINNNLSLVSKVDANYYVYNSSYNQGIDLIGLDHIFYDFSPIIG